MRPGGRYSVVCSKIRNIRGWKRGAFRPGTPVLKPALLSRLRMATAATLNKDVIRIEDQSTVGCCVAESCTSALEYAAWKQTGNMIQLSALWAYAKVRLYEGTPLAEDSGAQIPGMMDVLTGQGCANDTDWPFELDHWNMAPPDVLQPTALRHRLGFWCRTPSLATIRYSLAAGFPVVVGIDLPEVAMSDDVALTGKIPTPTPGMSFAGGHAILLTGYDDLLRRAAFANSWGLGWGMRGYGSLSYDFIDSGYVADAVTLRSTLT